MTSVGWATFAECCLLLEWTDCTIWTRRTRPWLLWRDETWEHPSRCSDLCVHLESMCYDDKGKQIHDEIARQGLLAHCAMQCSSGHVCRVRYCLKGWWAAFAKWFLMECLDCKVCTRRSRPASTWLLLRDAAWENFSRCSDLCMHLESKFHDQSSCCWQGETNPWWDFNAGVASTLCWAIL